MFTSTNPLVITLLFALTSALTTPADPKTVIGLTQANFNLAWLIDSHDFSALSTVLTDDVTFDATDFLPFKGGKANGIAEVTGAFEHDGKGAKTEHLVSNVLIGKEVGEGRVRVASYITYSHWVESALDNVTQTYRIYYRCDDVWTQQQKAWKLKSRKIYDMGYGPEVPAVGKQ